MILVVIIAITEGTGHGASRVSLFLLKPLQLKLIGIIIKLLGTGGIVLSIGDGE